MHSVFFAIKTKKSRFYFFIQEKRLIFAPRNFIIEEINQEIPYRRNKFK